MRGFLEVADFEIDIKSYNISKHVKMRQNTLKLAKSYSHTLKTSRNTLKHAGKSNVFKNIKICKWRINYNGAWCNYNVI